MQIGLERACELLEISEATGRNWVRLKRLTPISTVPLLFDEKYIIALSHELKGEGTGRLKSRRNKSKRTGNALYSSYIDESPNLSVIEKIVESAKPEDCNAILGAAARRLVLSRNPADAYVYASLIQAIAGEADSHSAFCEGLSFVPGEDTLGLLYISLRDMGGRKAQGAYFTPARLVKELSDSVINSVNVADKRIFDPCCGTGNFLLYMSRFADSPKQLYGMDTDETSIYITRLNIALNCECESLDFLYDNFTVGDTLINAPCGFDIVIGNPPWGGSFTAKELAYLIEHYTTASRKGTESVGLFTERSLSLLSNGGVLALIMPEAVLNNEIHSKTRSLLKNCSFLSVRYVGNVFFGVQCPAVLLCVRKDGLGKTEGCHVKTVQDEFTIGADRCLSNSRFMLDVNDSELGCIKQMESGNRLYLENNAVFALGIVTGSNKELLSDVKLDGYEGILRGSDIRRYEISEPTSYIKFDRSAFQQCAREELYRASPKLFYRFISDEPILAYDGDGMLSLNSCNVLIPKIPDMSMKYVQAVLNSRAAAFYFKKKFSSLKVLRYHLEHIPIPYADRGTQELIAKKTDLISSDKGLYDEIDEIITGLYGLKYRSAASGSSVTDFIAGTD